MLLLLPLLGCSVDALPQGEDDTGAPTAPRPGLTVVVSEEGTGEPLAGAWVSLTPGGRDALSDATGEATFTGLEPGSYMATVAAPGHVAGRIAVDVAADLSLPVPLTALVEGTGAIRGVAWAPGASGAPVVGATVEVDGVAAGVSDDAGQWWARNLAVGRHEVRVVPPAGSSLLPWESAAVEVTAGMGAVMSTVLPGSAPAGATFTGSGACTSCHVDAAALHAVGGHGRSGRSPTTVEAEGPAGLVTAFQAGSAVSLDSAIPGASVTLARSGPGAWTASVHDDDGTATPAWPVVEVYGGHRTGAALAVDADGVRLLLPLVWAVEGAGLPAGREAAGWVPQWTDAWFDASGQLALRGDGRPGASADWDLMCAGCHATGAALVEAGNGHYTLAPIAGEMERTVGCEACHGAGSAHVAAATADAESASSIFTPTDLPAAVRVDVCARCHARTTPTAAPFADTPGWPMDGEGHGLPPWVKLGAYTTVAPDQWADIPVSRVHRDEAGDFQGSPHRGGTDAYQGACEDCHDAHGSTQPVGLRVASTDRMLCASCHLRAFPDPSVDATHAAHLEYAPGTWTPGACMSCHLPRGAFAFRPDGLSGAGEIRSHGLLPWSPAATVAEFDAVGVTTLPLGAAPTSACLDCHLQADAEAAANGSGCPCPSNDPTLRQTHVDLTGIYDEMFGSAP